MCQNEFKIEGQNFFFDDFAVEAFWDILGYIIDTVSLLWFKILVWVKVLGRGHSVICLFLSKLKCHQFVSYLSFCRCLCPVSKVVCWFVCLCHVMSKCLYVMYLVKLVKVIMV